MAQATLDIKKYLINNRPKPIWINEARELLNSTDGSCATVPFKPAGGEVYLYNPPKPSQNEDWKVDGYIWSNEGTRTVVDEPKIRKWCFHLLLRTENRKRITDKRYDKYKHKLHGITCTEVIVLP